MPIEPKPSIPITLSDGQVLEGTAPLVLIGPNGVGKTRLGTRLAASGYDRIPALRSLAFDASIPFQKRGDATRDVDNQINRNRDNPWEQANELNSVLAELKAEDSQSAVDYRDRAESSTSPGAPEVTRLKKLTLLWRLIFPGRELDLSTYDPKVNWSHGGRSTDKYNANQMSDGERGALYLIARVLRAKPGVVIVDEPEVHFHALLARAFWDALETDRSDCRFIYITHDIPFALSRSYARIGIVKDPQKVELVPVDAPIPPDLYESILGAASLSIVAKRIVFCEGNFGASPDAHIYGAWFQSPVSVVVPVGSCDQVRQAVEVFKANRTIANAVPLGLVERDYWPDSHLQALQTDGLHVLPASEIEAFLCIKDVAKAVATHQAVADFDQKYANFEGAVRARFVGIPLHKQILERAKCDISLRVRGIANSAYPESDLSATRTQLVGIVDVTRAIGDVGTVFDEHASAVHVALAAGASDFLKVLPGKDCLPLLCSQFGLTQPRYIELVTTALGQPDIDGDPALEQLRAALVVALTPHLPPRTVQ